MKLKYSLFALALISLLLLLFGYLYSIQTSMQTLEVAATSKLAVSEKSIEAAIESISAQQRFFVRDYSFWDDMAEAVRERDVEWIGTEFYGPLEIYDADAVWIVSQGELLYSQRSEDSSLDATMLTPPMSWSEVDQYADQEQITSFFKRTADNHLIAYYVGPVLYHSQPEKNTEPLGYLLVADVWDAAILTNLSEIVQASIAVTEFRTQSIEPHPNAQQLTRTILGFDKQPVALLSFTFYDTSVAVLADFFENSIQLSALLGLTGIVLCLLLFQLLILAPIQRLIRKLRESNAYVSKKELRKNASELALLSEEIDDYLAQSMRLKQKNRELRTADRELELILENLKKSEAATRHELRTSLRLAKAVESASDAMVITDADGHIEYVNPTWQKLNGYTLSEVVGKKPSILKSGRTNSTLYIRLWDTITDGEPFSSEEVINKRKDGSLYAAHVSIYPVVSNGKTVNFVGIAQDISERKERDHLRSEFISLASHQLRTPLTSLRWFSEMLKKRTRKLLPATELEMIDNIEKSAVRMISLVNRLLNLSRIETGRLSIVPKKTSVPKLLTGIKKELDTIAKQKGVRLSFHVPANLPLLKVDADLLGEVLLNLLSNSLKYTPKGGKVSLEVRERKNVMNFVVQDTGIGIPAAEQAHIFDRFFRASNAIEHDEQGSGLGLYLAKLLVESLGGEIHLQSEEGTGTTFSFFVPQEGAHKAGEISIVHTKV